MRDEKRDGRCQRVQASGDHKDLSQEPDRIDDRCITRTGLSRRARARRGLEVRSGKQHDDPGDQQGDPGKVEWEVAVASEAARSFGGFVCPGEMTTATVGHEFR